MKLSLNHSMPRFTAISEIGSIWFVYLYTKIRIRWLLFTLHLIHENKTTFDWEFNKCTQIKNNNNK